MLFVRKTCNAARMSNHEGLDADTDIPIGWILRLLAAMQNTGLIVISVGVTLGVLAAGAIPQLLVVSTNFVVDVSNCEWPCSIL